ncbi:hypothetical protein HOLleu_12295 [Holothuria leucospilota]|uniref:Uncharacterized protein n=1 Tax=Holothuria leucospilota TaxID=206669 RepID=A0A9Q1C9X7_HOLLE|nr:hypothetical protein HOLleu_12295 [Holothuria leucospilota]
MTSISMESDQFQPSQATNYNLSYRRSTLSLPPIKFHQIPSIALKEVPKLPPRKFPIEPIGPCRRWERLARFQGQLPNIRLFTDKPIVRELPPKTVRSYAIRKLKKGALHYPKLSRAKEEEEEEKSELECDPEDKVASDVIDDLCKRFRWTTTNERAIEGAHLPLPEIPLPSTELEETSNTLMHRPRIFEERPEPWQRIATIWDRCQTRKHVGQSLGNISSAEDQGIEKKKNQTAGKRSQRNLRPDISVIEEIYKLCEKENLTKTFVRQCPGYAGFLPRSPLKYEPMTRVPKQDLYMMSSMAAAYRSLPSCGKSRYSRRGPMSRTVTLTYPYNPYNKVENVPYFRKDMGTNW